MKNRIAMVAVVSALFVLATSVVCAGTISITQFTDDATSGISNAKTYTHTIDFGATGNSPTINDVPFTKMWSNYPDAYDAYTKVYTLSPDGYDFTASDEATGSNWTYGWKSAGNTNTSVADTQDVYDLLYDCMYPGGAGVTKPQTIELTGLIPGYTYDFRLYYRQWAAGTRTNTISFDETGDGIFDATTTISEDATAGAYYLSYQYTPTGETLLVKFSDYSGGPWHQYGFSNEVVSVPEPSALALLACGLIGLLAYAWRKRK